MQLIIQGGPHPGTFLSNQVWEEGLFIYIEMLRKKKIIFIKMQ